MGEAALKLKPLSVEEYLRTEEYSPFKREYVDGQIYALAGASDRHNRVSLNIAAILLGASRGGSCRVYTNDMKLRINTGIMNRYYYPDVMVTCDPEDDADLYKVSPCLIVEVLSPGTEGTDRREKLLAYQSIAALSHYLIVHPDERLVEVYRRDEQDGWWYHEFSQEATIKLTCPELKLTLDEIYEGL